MIPVPGRPNPERRPSPSALTRAVALAAAAMFIIAFLSGARVTLARAARSAPPAAASDVELRLAIRTELPTQYGANVWLESTDPVPLELDCEPSVLAGCEQRIRWRCDRGRLDLQESATRNRFFPPAKSAVATIEATVEFYPQKAGQSSPAPLVSKTASLRILSPSPGSLLRDGVIDGFKLGDYINPRSRGVRKTTFPGIHPDKYQPPHAFYLVDEASRDLPLSRHFRLGDFALDYPWYSLGKRQYIALDPGLVRKIEDLIDEMNRAGLPGDKIRLIYGFRSPAYNLGRINQDGDESLKSPFSMHQYGKAVDFILDADGDLRLDDLDHDGRITVRDTIPIVRCVNALDRRYRSQGVPLFGGCGVYDHHDFWERPVQTPYVHVDVRGYLGEEGNLVRWPGIWPGTKEAIFWGKL